MAKPQCNCGPCQSRREAQQRWNDKNREKKRAINAKATMKLRAQRRAELAQSSDVSDEELDRRALAMSGESNARSS
jgi:hypothetical protein